METRVTETPYSPPSVTFLGDAPHDGELLTQLTTLIRATKPGAIGMASAFISDEGARLYDGIVGGRQSRVVAGISGSVTSPQALRYLRGRRHEVRLGSSAQGLFHPKLLVGGRRFSTSGAISEPRCAYLGSANFTGRGLTVNIEVFVTTRDPVLLSGASAVFQRIWAAASPLTNRTLAAYEVAFARAQANRSSEDVDLLLGDRRTRRRSVLSPVVRPDLCNGVWVGLNSFTGEHTFQVEFPRSAGEALRSLIGGGTGKVDVQCSDGVIRTVIFDYYRSNGMYRLNVPNSVPLVGWARVNRRGALLVRRNDDGAEAGILAEIIRGERLRECESKSSILGSVGTTSTRRYGWY